MRISINTNKTTSASVKQVYKKMGVNLFDNRTNEGGGEREVCPEDKLF